MSLSRSPSPRRGGGWSSPGLNTPSASGRSSPRKGYGNLHLNGGINSVTWASAKQKSDEVNGYPAFSLRHNGFFARHARRISTSLPRFNLGARRDYADKEKLGRGRWYPSHGTRASRLRTFVASILRRARFRFLLILAFIFAVILFYVTRKSFQLPHALQVVDMVDSYEPSISKDVIPRWRKQICGNPSCQPRRRGDGMERPEGVGN